MGSLQSAGAAVGGIFLTKVTNFVVVAVTERAYIGTGGRENMSHFHIRKILTIAKHELLRLETAVATRGSLIKRR